MKTLYSSVFALLLVVFLHGVGLWGISSHTYDDGMTTNHFFIGNDLIHSWATYE